MSIPPSRALLQQRDYRARKAQHVADLEERCRRLDAENNELRKEVEDLKRRLTQVPVGPSGVNPELVRTHYLHCRRCPMSTGDASPHVVLVRNLFHIPNERVSLAFAHISGFGHCPEMVRDRTLRAPHSRHSLYIIVHDMHQYGLGSILIPLIPGSGIVRPHATVNSRSILACPFPTGGGSQFHRLACLIDK